MKARFTPHTAQACLGREPHPLTQAPRTLGRDYLLKGNQESGLGAGEEWKGVGALMLRFLLCPGESGVYWVGEGAGAGSDLGSLPDLRREGVRTGSQDT